MTTQKLVPEMLLGEARRYRQLKLKQVSHHAGLSQSYLSEIERGQKSPGMHVFLAICEGLNVSPLAIMECYLHEKDKPQDAQTHVGSYIDKYHRHEQFRQFNTTQKDVARNTVPVSVRSNTPHP
ncbi:MAG TPA: helix-turn-helix transcriptional regulator [Alphaproteobacteria bacterium]